MNNDKKLYNRYSGIDILKITSMVLITLIHYFGYSDVSKNQSLLFPNKIIILLLSTFTTVAVNIFPMITGYLLYSKKANNIRTFKLWSEGWFYSFILMFVGFIIVGNQISISKIAYSLFPFLTMHYWYLTTVIILYLLSPLFNSILKNIPKNKSRNLLIVAGSFLILYYATNPFISATTYVGHPRGVIWMGYLYLVGAHIKKCDIEGSDTHNTKNKKICVYSGLVAFVIIFALKYFNISTPLNSMQLLSDYSLLPFILTLSLFTLFKDVRIKSIGIKKVVAALAECSFGIYLIQEHSMIRGFYWSLFNANEYANSGLLIIQLLCAVLLLFPLAYIGHFIFKKVFDAIFIRIYNTFSKKVGLILRKLNILTEE